MTLSFRLAYLSMESYVWLNSCSLQNIKNGDSLLSENRVVFYFRNEMYYLRWRRSSVKRHLKRLLNRKIYQFFLVYVWSIGYKKKANINQKSCSFHIVFIKNKLNFFLIKFKHSFKLQINQVVWRGGLVIMFQSMRPGVDSSHRTSFFFNLNLELRSK